ncbi:Starch-binding associating with outer membrane [Pustulibacterium marinum]|uniref:Starch-binding associating with outer membrane n=2 Tax=Pustulibacterium marinum TaxID=1224947 RepID=A0A1I7IZ16_9FLAO|nr:Starch-binding associating with outer membrane [Pustulibacterium marinum]
MMITWISLCCIGCEELVEVEAPANQLGTLQVYEDVQTARAALDGLYASLRDQSVLAGGNSYGMGTLLDTYTDNLDCFYNDTNGTMDIYENQPMDTNNTIETVWNTAYEQIYYANSLVVGLTNSQAIDTDTKAQLIGETIVLRSLIYYYLAELFGAIPYTTSIDYQYNRQLDKMEEEVLYQQLITDVMEVMDGMAVSYRDTERTYVNRSVASLVLAKVYSTLGDYAATEQWASEVLGNELYSFETNLEEVFHKAGTHILWQMPPQLAGNATPEATFYFFEDAAPHAYALTENLVNSFSDADLRKQQWMVPVTVGGTTWYRVAKYQNIADNTNEYSVVFRMGEVYLLLAEALVQQGQTTAALPYINAIRTRAGLLPLSNGSTEELLDAILQESRHEFFTEGGHRFLELKRMGWLNTLLEVKPNWEDYNERWPLPLNELLLNAHLYPQNTGY